MSTISQRQQHARQEAAKETIYEAALEVIARADFEGLRMHDVAAAVGIATGTLYNYFKNKEDLLYFVDKRLHAAIRAIAERVSQKDGPADVRLREVVDEIFDFLDKYHIVFDLAERSGVPDRTPVEDKQKLFQDMLGFFEKILSEGVEQGVFRSVNTRRTATVLFESLVGVCETHKYLGDYDFTSSKREVLSLFQDYLKPL